MHIFKNVGASIWAHLVEEKDTLGVREDLKHQERMAYVWPHTHGPNGRAVLQKAPWIFSKVEQATLKEDIASF